MTVLLRAITGFLLMKLAVLGVNLFRFPVISSSFDASPADRWMVSDRVLPPVSLLIPMRNEQQRLANCLPGLLAQDVAEIILLDDQSTDDTLRVAQTMSEGVIRARVVSGTAPPQGWVGKNWACSQLARQASGEVLAFCDADVLMQPEALRSVLQEMRAQRADVFSVFPRQLTPTLGEGLVTPLIDDVLLCFLPFPLLRLPAPSAATANGALLLFTRPAYDYLGGFDSVHDVLVEDVALARRTRAEGLQLGLALGGHAVQTRMYPDYAAVVKGLSRGLVGVAGSRTRLVLATLWQLAVYVLPWGLARSRAGWTTPLLLGVLERVLVDLKTGRKLDWRLALQPLSAVAVIPVVAQALRPRQSWRGRTYP